MTPHRSSELSPESIHHLYPDLHSPHQSPRVSQLSTYLADCGGLKSQPSWRRARQYGGGEERSVDWWRGRASHQLCPGSRRRPLELRCPLRRSVGTVKSVNKLCFLDWFFPCIIACSALHLHIYPVFAQVAVLCRLLSLNWSWCFCLLLQNRTKENGKELQVKVA